jgi:hypothetical protein
VAAFCFTRAWLFENARVPVVLYRVASFIVKRESQHGVNGCDAAQVVRRF